MHPLRIPLATLEDTRQLGRLLALSVTTINPGVLLLYGSLGAGKTTLTRMLVEALPGGKEAEVASPSFTICNIYCTAPAVHHYDLYRLEENCLDQSLEESFDDASVVTIVEWPERLASRFLPDQGVSCRLVSDPEGGAARLAEFTFRDRTGRGRTGDRFLTLLASHYQQQRG